MSVLLFVKVIALTSIFDNSKSCVDAAIQLQLQSYCCSTQECLNSWCVGCRECSRRAGLTVMVALAVVKVVIMLMNLLGW